MSRTLTDLQATARKLEKIGRQAIAAGHRKALALAAKPMLDAAKAAAPVRTGVLKKSLTRSVSVNLTKGMAGAKIGSRKKTPGGRYLHLAEKKRHFLENAGNATRTQSMTILRNNLAREIDVAATKLRAKAGL